MFLAPTVEAQLDVWFWDALQPWREDLLNQSSAASSRGQKSRWCQLNCTPNANTSESHWERGLCPCTVINAGIDDVTEDVTKCVIKNLKLR